METLFISHPKGTPSLRPFAHLSWFINPFLSSSYVRLQCVQKQKRRQSKWNTDCVAWGVRVCNPSKKPFNREIPPLIKQIVSVKLPGRIYRYVGGPLTDCRSLNVQFLLWSTVVHRRLLVASNLMMIINTTVY